MVYPYLEMPIHCVIEEEAILHPDADAVLWHGQKTSFAALEARACQIAGVLAEHGAASGDRVGLACRRSPELLAAMLAILKIGGAYVPFLTDYPAERIAYMMGTADVKLILCDEASAAVLPQEARVRPVVLMNESAQPLEHACCPQGGQTMYILFTSGSTGRPKGVQIPHRALSDRLQSLRQWMEGEQGPVLCIANATFDIFITETLLALAQGYAVVMADEEEMLLPWKLAELMTAHQPRIAQFTPSRLQMCLRSTAFSQAAEGLSFTIVAGEMVSPGLVTQFKAHCSGRLVNMYGPTETAVYVTAGELREGEPVTIGAPLNNCRIYVLDQDRKPVLPTARGELYLAGPGLADGYVGRPDLTQELFLDDPFFQGERMYRSGDVGRLRLDGRIECLGRTDAQVKINGNRVELGEITDALREAGADEAVAIPLKNPDGSSSLCAIVTPETLDPAALRQSLALRLPSYMIPGRLLTLSGMPYNASGKLDMPALRALAEGDGEAALKALPTPAQEPPPAAPVSEDTLLDIWKQVLRQPALRADVSLFEQGGTSLSALSILSEYYNRHISMTLADFYRAPTVRAQAALLGDRVQPPPVRTKLPVFRPTQVPPLRQRKDGPFSTVLLTGATGFLGCASAPGTVGPGLPKDRVSAPGRRCRTASGNAVLVFRQRLDHPSEKSSGGVPGRRVSAGLRNGAEGLYRSRRAGGCALPRRRRRAPLRFGRPAPRHKSGGGPSSRLLCPDSRGCAVPHLHSQHQRLLRGGGPCGSPSVYRSRSGHRTKLAGQPVYPRQIFGGAGDLPRGGVRTVRQDLPDRAAHRPPVRRCLSEKSRFQRFLPDRAGCQAAAGPAGISGGPSTGTVPRGSVCGVHRGAGAGRQHCVPCDPARSCPPGPDAGRPVPQSGNSLRRRLLPAAFPGLGGTR